MNWLVSITRRLRYWCNVVSCFIKFGTAGARISQEVSNSGVVCNYGDFYPTTHGCFLGGPPSGLALTCHASLCWVSVPLSGWLLYYVLQKMVILSFHVHVLRFLEPRIMVCSVVFFITFVSAVFFSLCNLQEIGEKYFESVQPRSTDVESSTSNVVVQAPAP
ncbi:hypothetical protein V6N12_012368 [Hibiscus sabdariffa]|uniref:Uncharacterized protein n=1 Tax=Hibiscus sabdariffa TaxID=183260 RepID=A0ABR2CI09_9ROSI